MKKLTRRQQEFLSSFLDLYNQERELLHYTHLADYIGVSKISAYEMLRLLEKRGLVQAEYQLPNTRSGPGRPTVLFGPTKLATDLLARMSSASLDWEEWEDAKNNILDRLRTRQAEIHRTLMEDLLMRTSNQRSSIIFAAEMITAIILGLDSLTDSAEARFLQEELRKRTVVGEFGLSVFTGLGLGLTIAERTNRSLADFLITQSSRFHSVIGQLSEESRQQLNEFTTEVMQIIMGQSCFFLPLFRYFRIQSRVIRLKLRLSIRWQMKNVLRSKLPNSAITANVDLQQTN